MLFGRLLVGCGVWGLAAATTWSASNAYNGTTCSGSNLVASTITVWNNPAEASTGCTGGVNGSGCVAVNTFTSTCPIPPSNNFLYTFEVTYYGSTACSVGPGESDRAVVAVSPVAGSGYPNCSAYIDGTGGTTYVQGSCVQPTSGPAGQSVRYACGRFITALATLNNLDPDLPSPHAAPSPPTPPTPAPTLVRATTNGAVVGMQATPTIAAWLGVRFAAPPNGTNRWRPPMPATPWTRGAPMPATVHQPCFQHADHGITIGTEGGCLTVDIWAPTAAIPDVSALPVMVWIHGGAFVDYEPVYAAASPTRLVAASVAQGTPIIAVSVNYRLGGLGYMGLGGLRAEAGSHNSSGNYGMLDQVMALRWVRDNIRGWGGDPTRVTIYGESAGAYSACTHLASPLSRGLFSGAILESAYCGIVYIYPPVAESVGSACMAQNNCTTLACMRGLGESAAFNCMYPNLKATGLLRPPSPGVDELIAQVLPNIDGYFLTGPPIEGVRAEASVPVLVGSNMREMMLFAFTPTFERAGLAWDMDPVGLEGYADVLINAMAYRRYSPDGAAPSTIATQTMVARLLSLYPLAEYTAFAAAAAPLFEAALCHATTPPLPCNFTPSAAAAVAMGTDAFFTFTAEVLADAVTAGGQTAYRYLFAQTLAGGVGPAGPLFNGTGAFHSLDVPFVFNTFDTYANTTFPPLLSGWVPTPDELALSAYMQRSWINFAVYGSPNGVGAVGPDPLWPAWAPPSAGGAGEYMHLVVPGLGAGSGFHADALVALGGFSTTGAAAAAAADGGGGGGGGGGNPTSPPSTQHHSGMATTKLSAGDGAGIAVGAMVVLLLLGVGVAFGCRSGSDSKPKYTGLPAAAKGDPSHNYASA